VAPSHSRNSHLTRPLRPTIEVSEQLMAKILPMTTAHVVHFNAIEAGFFKEGDELSNLGTTGEASQEPTRTFRLRREHLRRWTIFCAPLGIACLVVLIWVGRAHRKGEPPIHAEAPAKTVTEDTVNVPAPAPVADIQAPSPSPEATGAVAANQQDDDAFKICRKAIDRRHAKDVLAACPQAIDTTPQSAELAVVLARTEFERGRARQALDWAKKAVELDAGQAEAYVYLGGAEQAAGRPSAAKAAYRRYLQLAPQGRHAADLRAVLANL